MAGHLEMLAASIFRPGAWIRRSKRCQLLPLPLKPFVENSAEQLVHADAKRARLLLESTQLFCCQGETSGNEHGLNLDQTQTRVNNYFLILSALYRNRGAPNVIGKPLKIIELRD